MRLFNLGEVTCLGVAGGPPLNLEEYLCILTVFLLDRHLCKICNSFLIQARGAGGGMFPGTFSSQGLAPGQSGGRFGFGFRHRGAVAAVATAVRLENKVLMLFSRISFWMINSSLLWEWNAKITSAHFL